MTPLQVIDERQAVLCGEYANEGMVAIMIRTTESGNCQIIGPQMDPQAVARML